MGVVEDEGVVVAEAEEDKDKVKVEEVEIRGEVQDRTLVRATPGTGPRGTRTCRHSRPAFAIGLMENQLISVLSLQPVHGRTIMFQNQTIKPEKLTSSAKKKKYKIYFTRLFRK